MKLWWGRHLACCHNFVLHANEIRFQYCNRIVSELVKTGGVTPHQHLAMMLFNIGDSLGGVSRDEVGRVAYARVIRMLAKANRPNPSLSFIATIRIIRSPI